MLNHLRPAIVIYLALTLLTGIAYPLAMTGVAQLAFPAAANGSLVEHDGKVLGSRLIGQAWSADKYFHGRPSAAGKGYDPTSSGGSNLGSTSAALVKRIQSDIAALGAAPGTVPGDAVTASGSGLDPDISPQFAALQVPRVARARGLAEDKLKTLIAAHTALPALGLVGEPRVNVLELNMDLDTLNPAGNG